jgi:hypothetical protein
MPGTILGSPFHFISADTEYDPNDITQAQQTGYSMEVFSGQKYISTNLSANFH